MRALSRALVFAVVVAAASSSHAALFLNNIQHFSDAGGVFFGGDSRIIAHP